MHNSGHQDIRITLAVVILAALIVAGCAARPNIPPVTTTATDMVTPGKFVWHDLLTEDLAGVKEFYGELLGWTFTTTDHPGYTLIWHDSRAIGGIVDMTKDGDDHDESQWVSLLSVVDVDGAVQSTVAAGGEVHVGPIDIPDRGRLAVVSDPQGAVVAYLRATQGDPPDRKADIGDWLWIELWTRELEPSTRFYTDLIGYELTEEELVDNKNYPVLSRDEVPRAGVVVYPLKEVRAHWLPYLRVEDPESLAARVEDLGGKVLLAPSDAARKGSVAIVLDPSGAPVAFQKWPVS